MFTHIRKHQQWLFIVIIAVVVVSFVIYFGPQYDNSGSSVRNDVMGSINGRPIAHKEYANTYREVMLRFLMATGQWPDQTDARRFGFDTERETLNRLLLLEKVKEHGIHISDEAAAKWIFSSFKDPETNELHRESYYGMMTNGLAQLGMSKEGFRRFAKNQIAIRQLTSLVGLTGELISPREADQLYREENLQANAQVIFFSSTNYANLGQDLEGLETFYTNRMALYRTPPKRQINYLKFAATNYLAEAEAQLAAVTNLTTMIDQIYIDKGTNSFTENGIVMSEEAAREKIKQQELEKIGREIAKEKSREFTRELNDVDPLKAERLLELAMTKGLAAEVSEPFTENQLIPNLGIQYQLTRQAFQLTEESPYTTPFVAEDGVYLVSLNRIIPSEIPPLDEIRGQVTVDFYQQKSLEAARDAANTFHISLTNKLAEGMSFKAICEETGHEPVQMPLFTRSTQSLPGGDRRADISSLKNLAFALDVGEVSQVSSTRDGAMIVYVNSFVSAHDMDVEKDLPDFTENLRRTRRTEVFSEWLQEGQSLLNFASPTE
ncbi:MAG: Peptidyl-prolyl cis-trans isomerase D [Verrucomicrobia subdivision 3 bacterium]|nr:Peptidyl-prolyl cis-trans isomerase D [Limisphaerales bacterium]MCS1413860.1 Peptidyl-prolyl cis-trans isomerase D [Limisphaerales bacterium]